MIKLLSTVFLVTLISLPTIFAKDVEDGAKKAKVLIIGDSISIGYTKFVKAVLKDQADVSRIKGNAQHTGTGLKKIDAWLGATQWDVIHFNWGLWDLCYRNPESEAQGKRDKIKGKITTTLEQYGKNLNLLIDRLKKTNATLIWANTTYVPDKEVGRKMGDDKKYNDVAAAMMHQNGIIINDLHTLTKGFSSDLFVSAGDVHYIKDGYQKIGKQVAVTIQNAIASE